MTMQPRTSGRTQLETARDLAAAYEIAELAGGHLLEVRASGLRGVALKDAGDAAAHEVIVRELRRRFPTDAIRSEEADDDPGCVAGRRVWIVDPLDGTREFAEPDRTDWAVHVALVVDGELEVGAVALPARSMTLTSAAPAPTPVAHTGPPRLLVSRTRPSEHALRVAGVLGAELVPLGSAGAKAMAVVLGEAEIYAHSGGQYEWDSAAPVAVAAAAGLHVSRLDGSPLRYNQPDPWLPDVLICRPELAAAVIDACRPVMS
jgi:3'(2'), 5'-bisphosphate nucleotidase